MRNAQLARLLAYVTGTINQRLLVQNEYLADENRILRSHLPARLSLSDPERCTLAEIAKRLGIRGKTATHRLLRARLGSQALDLVLKL